MRLLERQSNCPDGGSRQKESEHQVMLAQRGRWLRVKRPVQRRASNPTPLPSGNNRFFDGTHSGWTPPRGATPRLDLENAPRARAIAGGPHLLIPLPLVHRE